MQGRAHMLPDGIVARLVLMWGALGLVAGAAVGTLVHLETHSSAVYHGRYVALDQLSPRAYSSTLTITLAQRHPELMLLTGLAIGLLAGLVVGLVLGLSSRAWPSARLHR